jgi:hypothetical protein
MASTPEPKSGGMNAASPEGQLLAIGHYAGRGTSSGAKIEVTSAGIYRFEAGLIVFLKDWASQAEALEAAGLSE